MRWFARRRQARLIVEPIDSLDPASLEIVEVGADGQLHGPPGPQADPRPREVAYAPRDRDPTGLAGVWEAIARS